MLCVHRQPRLVATFWGPQEVLARLAFRNRLRSGSRTFWWPIRRKFSESVTLHTLRWTDPESLLECTLEMKEYSDFPAAEWVVHFRNTENQDTPIIENILPLDISSPNNNDVVLHRSHGSLGRESPFHP